MPYLIDPPVPWDDLAEWRRYLASLESELASNPGDKDLEDAIKEAREHIAKVENEAPGP